MPARLIVAMLLLASVRTPAQEAKCTLEGTAVDFSTGEPLRKTTVLLFSRSSSLHPSYQAATDASGNFRFTPIPEGHYTLTGKHPGYTDSALTLELNVGDKLSSLALKLTRCSTITGRIVDHTGSPVSKALVRAVSQQWLQGERVFDETHSAWTNDAGEYRISDLQPGHYYLCAGASTNLFVEKQGGPEMSSLETCYPDSRTLDGTMQLDLQAGQNALGMDMKLPVGPVFHIRGKIVDHAAAQEDTLSLQARLHGFGDLFELDEEDATGGKFDFSGASPGTYDIQLVANQDQIIAKATVDVKKSDVNNVILSIPSTLTVKGAVHLVDDDGTFEYHGHVRAFDANSPLMGGPYSADIASNGVFELKDLWPGKYVFSVDESRDDDIYVKSIQYESREMLGTPIALTTSTGGLEITLSKGVGTVQGSVINSDSEADVSGLKVVLTNPFHFFVNTADQNGNVTFSHVPPGKYHAFAVNADFGLLQNRDFVAQLQPDAIELDVPEGAGLQIKVPRLSSDDVQRAMASIQK